MLDAKTCAIAAKVLRKHAADLLVRNAELTETATTDAAGRNYIAEHFAEQRATAEACTAVADVIAPEDELAWLANEARARAVDCRNIAAKAVFAHDEQTRAGMAEAYDEVAWLIEQRRGKLR